MDILAEHLHRFCHSCMIQHMNSVRPADTQSLVSGVEPWTYGDGYDIGYQRLPRPSLFLYFTGSQLTRNSFVRRDLCISADTFQSSLLVPASIPVDIIEEVCMLGSDLISTAVCCTQDEASFCVRPESP